MGIKASLKDPHDVLDNWDEDAVDPCSWTMFTCSAESLVMNCIFEQGEAKLLD
nr:protein NSP-INTERACTING KINASE 1-like [Ipomoea batatas]GMD63229.1 protein NSP-INTERACTING KINASE 1-like [Ipomoea batatas]GMD72428.1 protein NSP-INTERACTING KINASE 1-like [Ipomoea batatas]GME14724.1 protein NSP-INTERACTING KINASE 1-like [Ipomoea batatas]